MHQCPSERWNPWPITRGVNQIPFGTTRRSGLDGRGEVVEALSRNRPRLPLGLRVPRSAVWLSLLVFPRLLLGAGAVARLPPRLFLRRLVLAPPRWISRR